MITPLSPNDSSHEPGPTAYAAANHDRPHGLDLRSWSIYVAVAFHTRACIPRAVTSTARLRLGRMCAKLTSTVCSLFSPRHRLAGVVGEAASAEQPLLLPQRARARAGMPLGAERPPRLGRKRRHRKELACRRTTGPAHGAGRSCDGR